MYCSYVPAVLWVKTVQFACLAADRKFMIAKHADFRLVQIVCNLIVAQSRELMSVSLGTERSYTSDAASCVYY